MKKQHFLIIDTETTQDNLVADFGAIIVDRRGRIQTQCAVLVNDVFNNSAHPLFFDSSLPADSLWSQKSADKRHAKYQKMVEAGSRMIASVNAINRWLERARGEYDPVLTAYNLSFDAGKMDNTGIDHTIFSQRFCLWHAACEKFASTKAYKNFILSIHGFNAPTKLGNMTYKTNAEIMARFVLETPDLGDEPHTALEDVIGYELPILMKLIGHEKLTDILKLAQGFNWRDYQVKNHFTGVA